MEPFFINVRGKIIPITYSPFFKEKSCLQGISWEGVKEYDLDENYSLVMSGVTQAIEIIDKETLRTLRTTPGHLKPAFYNYYEQRFPRDLDSVMKERKKRSKEYIDHMKKTSWISFVICPTYTCNMRCVYCYQGHENKNRGENSPISFEKVKLFIENEIKKLEKLYGKRNVSMELFGGEPLQISNQGFLEEFFQYAKEQEFFVAITTNGLELRHYEHLIEKYKSQIVSIYTNLDGTRSLHDQRRKFVSSHHDSGFDKIVEGIHCIRKLHIPMTIAINLDKKNIQALPEYLEWAQTQHLTDNDLISLEIGRVDDRFYKGTYQLCMSESELLKALLDMQTKIPFPRNIKFAFLKSTALLAEQFGWSFHQRENGKSPFHYCWASTPLDDVYYIDPALDVYRCTYTVGDPCFKIGNIKSGYQTESFLEMETKTCKSCEIGAYCSGGCCISGRVDWERHCREEKENFDNFVKKIMIPEIRMKMDKTIYGY